MVSKARYIGRFRISSNNIFVGAITGNLISNLFTSNVIESGNSEIGNIYLSNTRVVEALIPGDNVVIEPNGRISANATVSSLSSLPPIYTPNVIEEGNTTSGNVYFTNSRAVGAFTAGQNILLAANGLLSAVLTTLPDIYASNIIEDGTPTTGNVFFSNLRARRAWTAGPGIIINTNTGVIEAESTIPTLNTDLVTEGTANLYYTNARVYANIANTSIDIHRDVDTVTNLPTNGQALIWNTANARWQPGTISAGTTESANLANTATFALTANIANLASLATLATTATTVASLSNFTTSNLAEGSNLYFTNNRAIGSLTAGQNIFIETNGLISANVTVSALPQLYTPNIIEVGNTTTGNVYFTNTRARVALSVNPASANALTYNASTGVFTVSNSNVVIGSYGNATFTPRITVDEFGRVTNVTLFQSVPTLPTLYTSNIVEDGNTTAGNVYFTNVRARAAFTAGQNIVIESNGMIVGSTTSFSGNTNLIPEGSANLYYTNARVYANLLLANLRSLFDVSDALPSEGQVLTWDSVTSNWKPANFIAASALLANVANIANLVVSLSNHTTSNLAEGSNLYFTNTRAIGSLTAGDNIVIAANGRISANVTAGAIPQLYTPNIIEVGDTTSGNVYFTNTRARAAFTAGQNIVIEANGLIVAAATAFSGNTNSVPEGSANLYYTNARVLANVTTYRFNVLTTNNLFVSNIYGIDNTDPNTYIYAGNAVYIFDSTGTLTVPTLISTNVAFTLNALSDVTITNILDKQIIFYDQTQLAYRNANVSSLLIEGNNITIEPNGRISANVSAGALPTLYTSNIIENGNTTSGNVYFTNTRVRAAIGAGDTTINYDQGNGLFRVNTTSVASLVSGNISTLSLLGLNVDASNGISFYNLPSGGPDDFANITVRNPEGGEKIRLTFQVGNDGGGSFGPDAFEFISPATDAVYINNQKVWYAGNDGAGSGLDADLLDGYQGNAYLREGLVSTSNIIEGSNLYYTNARVYANVAPLLTNIIANLAAVSNIANTISNITTSNVAEGSNLYYTNERVYANVAPLLANITTSNVAEGSNLYFTNTRAVAVIQDTDTLLLGNLIPAVSGGRNLGNSTHPWNEIWVSEATIRIGNVALKGTGGRFIVESPSGNLAFFTGNIAESAGNLFFTNARARAAVSAANNLIYDQANGVFNTSNTVTFSTVTANAITANGLTVYGNLNVLGNVVGIFANTLLIDDPLIYLASNNTADVTDMGFVLNYMEDSQDKHAGLFRDATDKEFKLFANTPHSHASQIIDTSNAFFRFANLRVEALYSNVLVGNGIAITGLTTSNIREGSNLYFTNTRAIGSLTAGENIVIAANGRISATSNVTAGSLGDPLVVGNIRTSGNIFANGQFFSNVQPGDAAFVLASDTLVTNLNADFLRGYYPSITGTASTIALREFGGELTATYFSGNGAQLTGLTTSQILETGGNLYYSNARSRAAISAGDASIIYDEANGTIRANISASINTGTNASLNTLTITGNISSNSTQTGSLVVNGGLGVTGNLNANVVYSNLVQANTANISGNVIAARFIGDGSFLSNLQGGTITVKDEGGTVVNAVSSLNFIGAQIQASTLDNSNVDIVISVTGLPDNYISRNYVGNGSATQFPVGANVSSSSILIFYNGVAQTPNVDYSVNSGNVVFTSAPVANAAIHIRELSTSGMVGYTQPFRDKFIANGVLTQFTLETTPQNATQVMVFINGILQDSPENYTIAGRVITFSSAPAYNDEITVVYELADSAYDPGIARQIALAMLFSSY